MKLTIIGSGSAVIRKERKAPSMVLEVGNKTLLFDCGWGCGVNLLEAGFDIQKIDHIFITHPHADHMGDLVSLIFSMTVTGIFLPEKKRTKPLVIHGYKGLKKDFEVLHKIMHPEMIKYGFPFKLKVLEYTNSSRKIDDFDIKSKEVNHTEFFNAVAFRIEKGKKSFVYSGDTANNENLVKLSKDADLAVYEMSVPDWYFKKRGPAPTHLSPEECGQIAAQAGVKKLVLVHLYDNEPAKETRKAIKRNFKGQLIIPKDLQKIRI